jgi:acyl-coenzyme A synthetase/AMP-(fatty) acid ligase
VGIPDMLMGEQVCACIVLRDGATLSEEEVIAHCQNALAKYKTPRYVDFLKDLPKTTIGKIQKKELRKWASQRHAQDATQMLSDV